MKIKNILTVSLSTFALLLGIYGCDSQEKVKVVSSYNQPVNVKVEGYKPSVTLSANSEVTLPVKRFVGTGLYVTVRSKSGSQIYKGFVKAPGDSAFRKEAVLKIGP